MPDSTKRAERRADRPRAPRPVCAAARRAAAAGLLSSCASPAAIVPSEASRSRFCSIAGDAAHHRRDLRASRGWCTVRLREARAGGSSAAAIDRDPAGGLAPACGRRAAPPVSTAIAPIQVGACWRPDRLGAPVARRAAPARRPRAAAAGPAAARPARRAARPARRPRSARRRDPLRRAASSSRSSNRSTRAQVGERHGAALMRRPGTGGSSETAIEPSPTALATRLIERARTSPATNTPGTLVSSRYGSRLSGQPCRLRVGPGEDEAALVARDDAVEPVGARRGADEDEAGVDVERPRSPSASRIAQRAAGGRPRRRARDRLRCRCGPRRCASAAICSIR